MNIDRKIVEQALDGLMYGGTIDAMNEVMNALRTALEQPAPSVEPEVIKEKAYNTLMDSLAQKNAQIATALQAKLDVAREALEEIEYNGDPIAIKALAEIEAIK